MDPHYSSQVIHQHSQSHSAAQVASDLSKREYHGERVTVCAHFLERPPGGAVESQNVDRLVET